MNSSKMASLPFVFVLFTSVMGISSPIERPCRYNDYSCIRQNLAANSKCNPNVKGSIPSAYIVKSYRFETPYFNSSYIDNNLKITNHDKCFVREFYFNMVTDKGVLGVECRDLGFESDRTVLQHASLVEDSEFEYHINAVYPLLRFTVSLDRADTLDLCRDFTFTEIPLLPVFKVDPKNRPTANFLTRDLSELFIYERETFAARGQEVMHVFVNSLLCDFGC